MATDGITALLQLTGAVFCEQTKQNKHLPTGRTLFTLSSAITVRPQLLQRKKMK
jgi:hypothetical protein